jgi:hypothetical protein
MDHKLLDIDGAARFNEAFASPRRSLSLIAHSAITPPSTDRILPVVQRDSSDAK